MASILDLPSEIVVDIAKGVIECMATGHPNEAVITNMTDLRSLWLTCRSFRIIVKELLFRWNKEHECSSAVLWTIEHGRIDILEDCHAFGLDLINPGSHHHPNWMNTRFDLQPPFCCQTPMGRAISHDWLSVVEWFLENGVSANHICSAIDPRGGATWQCVQLTSLGDEDHVPRWSVLKYALHHKSSSIAENSILQGLGADLPGMPPPSYEEACFGANGASVRAVAGAQRPQNTRITNIVNEVMSQVDCELKDLKQLDDSVDVVSISSSIRQLCNYTTCRVVEDRQRYREAKVPERREEAKREIEKLFLSVFATVDWKRQGGKRVVCIATGAVCEGAEQALAGYEHLKYYWQALVGRNQIRFVVFRTAGLVFDSLGADKDRARLFADIAGLVAKAMKSYDAAAKHDYGPPAVRKKRDNTVSERIKILYYER